MNPERTRTPPAVLSIAGSDPSGGAGIQADLKTFSALGAYGMAAITALTAQNTLAVTAVHVPPASFLREQLDALLADVRIDAVKIGMLGTCEVIGVVAEWLADLRRARPQLSAVVLDPVMVATSGDRLLDTDALTAIRELLPAASIVTPNLPEAALLLGCPEATCVADMREQAAALVELGAQRVLLKGGHLRLDTADSAVSMDVFATQTSVLEVTAPLIATRNTHGTGCSLSSALAALRPQRDDWEQTVIDAKAWLTQALSRADELQIGHGHGPVHHFHALWDADHRQ